MIKNIYQRKFTFCLPQEENWHHSMGGKKLFPKTKDGRFIVFEGLDGSGQSTQVNLLTDFLKKKGCKILKTKEPTLKSQAGKTIRKVLDKEKRILPKELQTLFAQDRKEHLEGEIAPALKKGKIVISDRYFFSSFAFGTASGIPLSWLIKINNNFLMPDIVFFLKTDPETCVKRIKMRGDRITLFEKKEKLKKVFKVFKTLTKKFKHIKIINGEKPIKEVFEEIKKYIL